MSTPPPPFTALAWTAPLASALADASAALARLDARVCAISLRPGWTLRASWSGYAAALALQQSAVEEIDIIADRCGLRLPGRALVRTEDVNGQRTLHPTPHANSPDRQNSLHQRYFLTPFNIRAAALDDGASLRP